MIILFILMIIVMGSFFSGALVAFFQKKPMLGVLLLVLGLITAFLFYYSIYAGWVTLPESRG
ncbi:hypothetical protein [Paenibacillus piri]|uniref:DUF2759 domain-containing protein n=1 Tax=Paenibacillus piri TaxID=2547395 RepID=A0A4R5KTL4_9BACL|nr:hypothetical protein [Paenibacillus piri]TDF99201.1 hypothetical protein E1757_04880 [Paenibacillus piri]